MKRKYNFRAVIAGKEYFPKGFYYQGNHIILVGCEKEDHTIRRKEKIEDVEIFVEEKVPSFQKKDGNLSKEEKNVVKGLNYMASFDGIITEEQDIRYMLERGIEKFIPKKKRHLVSVTETTYPIRIKISKIKP